MNNLVTAHKNKDNIGKENKGKKKLPRKAVFQKD
jgi:hypothetical protein